MAELLVTDITHAYRELSPAKILSELLQTSNSSYEKFLCPARDFAKTNIPICMTYVRFSCYIGCYTI